jgi:hypothetical protein
MSILIFGTDIEILTFIILMCFTSLASAVFLSMYRLVAAAAPVEVAMSQQWDVSDGYDDAVRMMMRKEQENQMLAVDCLFVYECFAAVPVCQVIRPVI